MTEFRNAQHNQHGGITLEFNHPTYGWIPCATHPNDPPTAALYAEALASGTALPYVRPVAEAKLSKLAEIEAARDAAVAANATALGYQWQADDRSVKLLNGAITLGAQGAPLPAVWRTADNVNMPVTSLGDLLAIAAAIAEQTQTAYAVSWSRKAAVEAATTVQQVEAITWN